MDKQIIHLFQEEKTEDLRVLLTDVTEKEVSVQSFSYSYTENIIIPPFLLNGNNI